VRALSAYIRTLDAVPPASLVANGARR
jgi:hypothetical protein